MIGEAGIVAGQAALASFSAKTFCTLYRIENSYLKPCLEARRDINEAMKNLLDVRMHLAQNLTREAPSPSPRNASCNGCAAAPEALV